MAKFYRAIHNNWHEITDESCFIIYVLHYTYYIRVQVKTSATHRLRPVDTLRVTLSSSCFRTRTSVLKPNCAGSYVRTNDVSRLYVSRVYDMAPVHAITENRPVQGRDQWRIERKQIGLDVKNQKGPFDLINFLLSPCV